MRVVVQKPKGRKTRDPPIRRGRVAAGVAELGVFLTEQRGHGSCPVPAPLQFLSVSKRLLRLRFSRNPWRTLQLSSPGGCGVTQWDFTGRKVAWAPSRVPVATSCSLVREGLVAEGSLL